MLPFISGLESFQATIKAAKSKAHGTVTANYRAMVRGVLRDLAENTPQWSGDLAASWQVVVGKNAMPQDQGVNPTGLKHDKYDRDLKFKGDKAAVDKALNLNATDIASIKWNSKVYIINVNPTVTGGGDGPPITEDTLRPGNYIPGDIMAVNHVAMLWSHKNGRGLQLTGSELD